MSTLVLRLVNYNVTARSCELVHGPHKRWVYLGISTMDSCNNNLANYGATHCNSVVVYYTVYLKWRNEHMNEL